MRQIKKIVDSIVDMLFRGVFGLVLVYGIGALCRFFEAPVLVGVNPATFCLIAFLGVPGFFLSFAIGIIGCF